MLGKHNEIRNGTYKNESFRTSRDLNYNFNKYTMDSINFRLEIAE